MYSIPQYNFKPLTGFKGFQFDRKFGTFIVKDPKGQVEFMSSEIDSFAKLEEELKWRINQVEVAS